MKPEQRVSEKSILRAEPYVYAGKDMSITAGERYCTNKRRKNRRYRFECYALSLEIQTALVFKSENG